MLRQGFNIFATAAVLFTPLQGTQGQGRLTTTIAILDATLIAPAVESVTTRSKEHQSQCPDQAQNDMESSGNTDQLGHSVGTWCFRMYARTCWGFFAI